MRKDVEDHLYSHNGSTDSIEDQIAIAHAMWENDISPDHEGLKLDEIEGSLDLELEYDVETSMGHLQDADVTTGGSPPGPDTYVIASWMDDGEGEIVNGRVGEAAEEGNEALAEDVEKDMSPSTGAAAVDGGGKAAVLADRFDLASDKVPEFLRTTDREVEVLNQAVEAIEEADGVEVGDDYGEIVFLNAPHQHNLSEKAMALYAK